MPNVEYKSYYGKVLHQFEGFSDAALDTGMQMWRNEILKKLRGTRAGRRYKVPGTLHKYYHASLPGESPASATGQLRTSVATVNAKKVKQGGVYKATIGIPLEYAGILESGSAGGKIAARPYFWIAYTENKKRIQDAMRRAYKFA
jgi:hypothetical protein